METIRFVEMMDHFFDCLNVNNFSTSEKIKPFQWPYISVTDFRLTVRYTIIVYTHTFIVLQWLQEEFRPYLREWESSVHSMDIPTKEQNKLARKSAMVLMLQVRYFTRVVV